MIQEALMLVAGLGYMKEATKIVRGLFCSGVTDARWQQWIQKHIEVQSAIWELAYQLAAAYESGREATRGER